MSGDEWAMLPAKKGRKTAPTAKPGTSAPVGENAGRALGNRFLEKSDRPRATDFGEVTMEFDGDDLIVRGDGREVYRFAGQSGRPVPLTDADARASGADQVTATYMNDKRFVGVTDFGPIPEGAYTLRPPTIERFSEHDESAMRWAGILGSPHEMVVNGSVIHTGDWGSGRVALTPKGRLKPGPPGIGDVYRRTGFFLHGGTLAGSSGCIDIDSNFDTVVAFLQGYPKPITVTVEYRSDPPIPGFFQGTSGWIAYGHSRHRLGPTIGFGSESTPTGPRHLASVELDYVWQWAGGAWSSGLRLDIPFTDKESFVRAGLTSGVDFRIFRPLHGRIFAGYDVELGAAEPKHGSEAGVGLRLDLNRVQLEAVYNVLRPLADGDERMRQTLLDIGFRF